MAYKTACQLKFLKSPAVLQNSSSFITL